jgi:hypothetical protein
MRQGGGRAVVGLALGLLIAAPGCASVGDRGEATARGVAQRTFRAARAAGRAAYEAGKGGTDAIARRIARSRGASAAPDSLLAEPAGGDPPAVAVRVPDEPEAVETAEGERPGDIILAGHREPGRASSRAATGGAIRHNLPTLDLDDELARAGKPGSAWR